MIFCKLSCHPHSCLRPNFWSLGQGWSSVALRFNSPFTTATTVAVPTSFMNPQPQQSDSTRPKYVGAIDQGTSSTRFIIFDQSGSVVASHQTEFPQHHPQAGWCEHNPLDILESVHVCIEQAVSQFIHRGYTLSDLVAVGITNQRETTCVWSSVTTLPLHPALVWLDTRTKGVVDRIMEGTSTKDKCHYQPITGLPLSTYFSAVKLRWLLDNAPAVQSAAADGSLRFGTIDSWLMYKLTGGRVHCTDVTNASRTLLMDLRTQQWSEEMCQVFGIPSFVLPTIRSSSEIYGYIADGPLAGVPISGCLGDQQAALVGQKCFAKGSAKNTYGTGCFMLFNTGEAPVFSKHGLLTTVAYKLGPTAPTHFALEGSVAIAGAAVRWLRDNMGLISESSQISDLAAQVTDSGDIFFVPAFSGLFAPHWRDDARGCIVGLTQHTNKCHLARATLEAVALQTCEILQAMNQDADGDLPITALRVDGGMTNSDVLMQIQADVLGLEVDRPVMRETTALGAALAAGRAVGVWSDPLEVGFRPRQGTRVFEPSTSPEWRLDRMEGWKRALDRSLNWTC